ncbi:MAG: efflux RND transporter permease subunit [Thermoplasmatota archaeon]
MANTLMERLGSIVNKHPWITISIILIITAAAVLQMAIVGMEESFDTEDFMPDMEVAQAWTQYEEVFTSNYPLMTLVKDPDGDMLTVDSMRDLVELSDRIRANETFEIWQDESSMTANPDSPATALHSMRTSVDSGESMIDLGISMGEMIQASLSINESVSDFNSRVEGSIWTGNQTAAFQDLSGVVEEYFEETGAIDLSPVVTPDIHDYYGTFETDQELKDEVEYLVNYDVMSPDITNGTVNSMAYIGISSRSVDNLDSVLKVLDSIISGGEIQGSNVSISDLESLRVDLLEIRDDLQEKIDIALARGNPLAISGIVQGYYASTYVFDIYLTSDYDPGVGSYSAEGCLFSISLNYTLNRMSMDDPDRLLKIEKSIASLIEDFDDETDMSYSPLGNEIINNEIMDASNSSMMILMPAAVVLVVIILSIIYRSVIDVLLNLGGLMMAIIWMYGAGSLLGFSTNPMITAVPVLIVGLGIDYGIHITMRYREEVRKGRTVRDAIKGMSGSVGMALLLATFTTVMAFMSNLASPIGLVMQFGVLAAIGILASFIIMLTFLPAVKRIRDVRRAEKKKPLFGRIKEGNNQSDGKKSSGVKILNTVFSSFAVMSERRPVIVLIITLIITGGMFTAAVQNEMTFNINDFLPDDLEVSDDINYLMNNFEFGTGDEQGIILVNGNLTDPDVLRSMHRSLELAAELNSEFIPMEGQSGLPKSGFILFSLRDMAISNPMGEFSMEYSNVFDSMTSLPRENSTSDDIKRVLDMYYDSYKSLAMQFIHRENGEYTQGILTITVMTENDKEAFKLMDQLNEIIDPIEDLLGSGVNNVRVTGSSILMAVISDTLTNSQIRSLVITMFVSLLVLTIVFFIEEKAILLGAVATLPMIFCVIWITGTMYIVGIPLNMMTVTIGSLTVGLGITYGIHITHRFVEDARKTEDLEVATKETIMNTGTALFGAAATTIAGFGLLSLSIMPPLQQFGIVTALSILYSFLSSLIVLPALLVLWAKGKRKMQKRKEKAKAA